MGLNNVQNGLDAVGLVGGAFLPGLADLADVVNAGISAARGDWVGAGLSLGAAIPVFGTVIGSGKSVLRNVRTLDALAYGASVRLCLTHCPPWAALSRLPWGCRLPCKERDR